MKRLNKQSGISLVEIMVSLVISLFLLAGIVQVYTGNRATFSFSNALAEVQENGRFALDIISQDLRLAAEWGCFEFEPEVRPGVPLSFYDNNERINDTLNGGTVPGYDAKVHDFVGEDPLTATNNLGLNGSDTLTIRGGKPGQANIESPFYGSGSTRLTTDAINSIGAGDIVLVVRCGENDLWGEPEADILRVTSSLPITGNSQRELTFSAGVSQAFQNDATLIELQTVNYSIAAGASNEPALFRQEFVNAPQELVEGVEDMQILYGVDTDDDDFANQYMNSDAVTDFNDVVSVRITLLVRSIDDFVTEDPQTYTYNGAQTTAGDRRIRQIFSATVALRNRIGYFDGP
jgi:type IV pilus assembly protein PilW